MKAIILQGNGEPRDVLTLGDVPDPAAPGDGQAVVRIAKRIVHPADTMAIRGQLPTAAFVEDGVPGIDGAGVIEAVGPGVDAATGIAPGARVILYPIRRSWAERVLAPVAALTPVPDDIDDAVAAQLATNGITALMLLQAAEQADANGEAPLLVTAAGSGVARNVAALVAARGRKVIGLVRRDADAAHLTERFDNLTVIGTDRDDWQEAVRVASEHPPRVAIDPLGGEMMPALLDLLAPGGTLIVYGGADLRPAQVWSGLVTSKELTIRGANAFLWAMRTTPTQRATHYADLFDLARQTPHLFEGTREFPLAQAVEAIAAAQESPRRGATILVSDA